VQNPASVRPTEESLWLPFRPILAAIVAAASGMVVPVQAASIIAGDLVIYRVGDGGAALSANATAVFLDEYTTAGILVQSIPLPTTGTSSLTAVGNATTEGILTVSQDGNSLLFTGYRKDVGGATPNTDPATTTNRVIASAGLDGVVNTSVSLTDTGTGTHTIRSASTVNGSFYYVGTSVGVRYVPTPGPATTSVLIDSRNSREVLLNDNTLYVSNGSTGTNTFKVQSYGVLPTGTTTAMPLIILATTDAVNGFTLFDLDATVPGVDTMYLLSTVEGLLRKYSFDGANWIDSGSVPSGLAQNLTGYLSGGTVNLFITSPASLLPFVDTTGYGNSINGMSLGTALATAGTNTAFRGIAYVAVPEPSAAIVCVLVAVVAIGTRRLRRDV
jgi:hypothetical protein